MNFGTTDWILILVLLFVYLNGRTLESIEKLLFRRLGSFEAPDSLDNRTLYERMKCLEDTLGEISYTLSQLFGKDRFDEEVLEGLDIAGPPPLGWEEEKEQNATIFGIAERLGTVSKTLERIEGGLKTSHG